MLIDLVLPAALLAVGAGFDMAKRIIPDSVSLGLLGCAALGLAQEGAALESLAVALAVFAGGAAFFAMGWMGGGDVKLAAATSLTVGAGATPIFLLWTSLAGLVVALVTFAAQFGAACPANGPRAALAQARAARLPYGVAIAAGGIAALWLKG